MKMLRKWSFLNFYKMPFKINATYAVLVKCKTSTDNSLLIIDNHLWSLSSDLETWDEKGKERFNSAVQIAKKSNGKVA